MSRFFRQLCFLLPLLLLGCGRSKEAPHNEVASVTYSRDIAPILFSHCITCHRPGEAAPFSLLTYEDARARASQIGEVTRSRFMPPWLPEAGHAEFQNERRLSDAQIELLSKWIADGAPEGDPRDLLPLPQFASGWQLGEPDLVLETPPFELSAAGADQFRNFVLDIPEGAARWIRAVELRPLHPRVTHHIRLGIDATHESMRRDAADPQPGYEGMAWGQDPAGHLITWTPGMTPDRGTSGAAWKLTADDKLVLHAHLQPSGKPETVRFRVGLHFADAAPTVRPLILRIGSRDIDIPAGESRHTVKENYELPIDVDLLSIFPHAHKLSREILVKAVQSDGTAQTLIAIDSFDENWHDNYRFAQPIRLPRGTRLETKFRYDNSTANVRNPHHPPQRVVYGSNANDEMSDVYLQVTPVDPNQFAVLEEHQRQAELRSKIVGYRKTLEMYPSDPFAIEGLASCHIASGQPTQAIQLLAANPQHVKQSPQATLLLGMACLANNDPQTAETLLREALKTDDQLPLAWAGLGQVLVAQDNLQLAEEACSRALQLAPQLLVARLDLIDLLVRQERIDEALAAAQKAVEIAPDDHRPLLKLANLYATKRDYDKSLATFAAARKLAPFVYSPQASLAIACYQLGDEQTADRLLSEARELDPTDPVPRFFLGQIASRNADLPAAQKHLQLAAELPTLPTWPASHVKQFLKLLYTEQLLVAQQLDDEELARKVLTNWSRLEPDNDAVRKLLAELKGARTD